jgi:hypothetical protein
MSNQMIECNPITSAVTEEWKSVPSAHATSGVIPLSGNVVGMVVFEDQVIVATELGVFKLVDDTLVRIPFEGEESA